jgi:hypothetical protein
MTPENRRLCEEAGLLGPTQLLYEDSRLETLISLVREEAIEEAAHAAINHFDGPCETVTGIEVVRIDAINQGRRDAAKAIRALKQKEPT